MPEFRLVQRPEFSPTSCLLCGDHVGPFVDTFFDLEGYGHLYICAANEHRSGCITQMAELTGMAPAREKQDLYDELNSLEGEVAELEEQVAAFVKLKELREFLMMHPTENGEVKAEVEA